MRQTSRLSSSVRLRKVLPWLPVTVSAWSRLLRTLSSTHSANRVPHYSDKALLPMTLLHDDAINPLFRAVAVVKAITISPLPLPQ